MGRPHRPDDLNVGPANPGRTSRTRANSRRAAEHKFPQDYNGCWLLANGCRTLCRMRRLPPALAAADPRIVRPRDLRDVYAQPAGELRELAEQGALLRVAHGYYAVVPEDLRHVGGWRPTVEGVALAVAQRDYGHEPVALMGISAARLLGLVPRAAATAVVAVPKQRPAIATTAGRVVFVTRAVDILGIQRTSTDLTDGWTTDPEQTLLDLVDRPELGSFAPGDVEAAIAALVGQADLDVVDQLATAQRKRAALERVRALARA